MSPCKQSDRLQTRIDRRTMPMRVPCIEFLRTLARSKLSTNPSRTHRAPSKRGSRAAMWLWQSVWAGLGLEILRICWYILRYRISTFGYFIAFVRVCLHIPGYPGLCFCGHDWSQSVHSLICFPCSSLLSHSLLCLQ